MNKTLGYVSLVSTAALVAASAFASACSSDDDSGGSSGTGGGGGAMPDAGGGGGGATGGAGGGGGGGTTDAGGPATTPCVEADSDVDPGGTAADGEDCCGGLGSCTDVSGLPASQQAALGHEDCDPSLVCAPKATDTPASCRSLGDVEGRCLPTCFLLGNSAAPNLQQGTCADGEACAPCYDPFTGDSTGACEQTYNDGTDAPVEAAPAPYDKCGGDIGFTADPDGGAPGVDLGTCVPADAVAPAQQDIIAHTAGMCSNPTDLCAPTNIALDISTCNTPCKTQLDTVTGNGACVPMFAVNDIQRPFLVGEVGPPCADGEVCAPCTNPLDMPPSITGACESYLP